MTGVSTPNIPSSAAIGEVIGNAIDGSIRRTVRISLADLSTQLLADGPIADAVIGGASGFTIYLTEADVRADLTPAAGAGAWVSTGSGAGIYRKLGATGTGSWQRVGDLPYSVIGLTCAGTGDAIVATSSRPVPAQDLSAIMMFSPPAANTGAATLAINGAPPLSVLTAGGSTPAAGALDPARIYQVMQVGGAYRLTVEGDLVAALAAAAASASSAAALKAETAAARDDAAAYAAAAAASAALNTDAVTFTSQTRSTAQRGQARSNIGAAASGANADITSLSGLTTPLTVAQGGTGDASGAGLVQPGTIVGFPFSSAPPGYLKANAPLLSRTVYSALFAKIGTAFGAGDGSTTFVGGPDMRGEFPRGWDDGRGVDSGRALGSAQADAFRSHTHTGSVGTTLNNAAVSAGFIVPQSDGSTGIGYTGGAETRPRNVALLYCIKY